MWFNIGFWLLVGSVVWLGRIIKNHSSRRFLLLYAAILLCLEPAARSLGTSFEWRILCAALPLASVLVLGYWVLLVLFGLDKSKAPSEDSHP